MQPIRFDISSTGGATSNYRSALPTNVVNNDHRFQLSKYQKGYSTFQSHDWESRTLRWPGTNRTQVTGMLESPKGIAEDQRSTSVREGKTEPEMMRQDQKFRNTTVEERTENFSDMAKWRSFDDDRSSSSYLQHPSSPSNWSSHPGTFSSQVPLIPTSLRMPLLSPPGSNILNDGKGQAFPISPSKPATLGLPPPPLPPIQTPRGFASLPIPYCPPLIRIPTISSQHPRQFINASNVFLDSKLDSKADDVSAGLGTSAAKPIMTRTCSLDYSIIQLPDLKSNSQVGDTMGPGAMDFMKHMEKILATKFLEVTQKSLNSATASKSRRSHSRDRDGNRRRASSPSASSSIEHSRRSPRNPVDTRHKRHSSGDRSKRKRKKKRRTSSSSSSSSSSDSSSTNYSAKSNSPIHSGNVRNYRRNKNLSDERRRSEFCVMCQKRIRGSFLAHRRGHSHIRKEEQAHNGCSMCEVKCFKTHSEYEAHQASREHSQRQSEVDARNRERLGLPREKTVIVRNRPGIDRQESLSEVQNPINFDLEPNMNRAIEQTDAELLSKKTANEKVSGEEWEQVKVSGEEWEQVKVSGEEWEQVNVGGEGRSLEYSLNHEQSTTGQLEDGKRSGQNATIPSPTQVTSTTAEKMVRENNAGRDWVVPVSGYYCTVCRYFFNSNSAKDLTSHRLSEKHGENLRMQQTEVKQNKASPPPPHSPLLPFLPPA